MQRGDGGRRVSTAKLDVHEIGLGAHFRHIVALQPRVVQCFGVARQRDIPCLVVDIVLRNRDAHRQHEPIENQHRGWHLDVVFAGKPDNAQIAASPSAKRPMPPRRMARNILYARFDGFVADPDRIVQALVEEGNPPSGSG